MGFYTRFLLKPNFAVGPRHKGVLSSWQEMDVRLWPIGLEICVAINKELHEYGHGKPC